MYNLHPNDTALTPMDTRANITKKAALLLEETPKIMRQPCKIVVLRRDMAKQKPQRGGKSYNKTSVNDNKKAAVRQTLIN